MLEGEAEKWLWDEMRKYPKRTSYAILTITGAGLLYWGNAIATIIGSGVIAVAAVIALSDFYGWLGGLWRGYQACRRIDRATPNELEVLWNFYKANQRLVGFDLKSSGVKTLNADGVIVLKHPFGERHGEFLISEPAFRHLHRHHAKLFAKIQGP